MLVWYNAVGLVVMYWALQWALPRAAGPAFRRLPQTERVILVHHAMYCAVFALQVAPLTWRMGGAPLHSHPQDACFLVWCGAMARPLLVPCTA